jgi:hypothetical protein
VKKFLLHIVLFFSVIVLFAFAADRVVTQSLRKSRKGDFAIWNDLFDGKINSDVVIYGSSRAWVHINPKVIEDSTGLNAYNLGIDGHNFYMQYLRHRLLMKYNRRPKLIICSLDVFTLDKRRDLFNFQQFFPYLSDSLVQAATTTYEGFSLFEYHLPLLRYVGHLQLSEDGFLDHSVFKGNGRYKGFRGQHKTWTTEYDRAKAEIGTYVQHFDTASFRLFEQFLQETKKEGISVAFVYTPEYIEGQRFVSNRNEVFALYHRLSEKYNIPFYDFSGDDISFDKKYFYNSEHMNYIGSDLFTRKLVSQLRPRLAGNTLASSAVAPSGKDAVKN